MTKTEGEARREALPPRKPTESPAAASPDRARERRRLAVGLLIVVLLLGSLALWLYQRGREHLQDPNVGPTPRTVLVITGPGKGAAPEFARPLGVAWAADGRILVSDTGNGRICVFERTGQFVREFGGPKTNLLGKAEPGVLVQPAGIAVGPDGSIFVADVRADAIVVFDKRGKFVRRITRPVSTKQPRWSPTDVALANGRLYVTDSAGVASFSLEGTGTHRFNEAGPGSPFAHPNGVAVRPDGSMLVSDTNNTRVVALDASGSPLWSTGPSLSDRRIVGLPRGIATAENGTVLLADAFLFGVTSLAPDGTYLGTWGGRGDIPGQFEYPNDVAVAGELVLIADKENNRIQLAIYPGLLTQAQ